MPYHSTGRLPGERASKLGHLEVIKSELVNELIDSFESIEDPPTAEIEGVSSENYTYSPISDIVGDAKPLNVVFGIDGSKQTIKGSHNKRKEMSFIKTALLRIDKYALNKINKRNPHPKQIKDALENSAVYHSTVIPLRNVKPRTIGLYNGIRHIIYDSIRDKSLDDEIYTTLRWLIFEMWDGKGKAESEKFDCPFCRKVEGVLRQDKEKGVCKNCNKELLLSDYLAFHLEMSEDFASETVASSYMLIHETLLLFTAVRHFWENDRDYLNECLFVKDGGLYLRAHYSKLVAPIRRFLQYAKETNVPIFMIGQEKTGIFVEFLEYFSKKMEDNTVFLPKDDFIQEKILSKPNLSGPYGKTGNFGAKLLVKLKTHNLVLSIPTGTFTKNPELTDLIGLDRILATIPELLSFRYENGLLPIELANGIASLSTYPSARILQLFSNL